MCFLISFSRHAACLQLPFPCHFPPCHVIFFCLSFSSHLTWSNVLHIHTICIWYTCVLCIHLGKVFLVVIFAATSGTHAFRGEMNSNRGAHQVHSHKPAFFFLSTSSEKSRSFSCKKTVFSVVLMMVAVAVAICQVSKFLYYLIWYNAHLLHFFLAKP